MNSSWDLAASLAGVLLVVVLGGTLLTGAGVVGFAGHLGYENYKNQSQAEARNDKIRANNDKIRANNAKIFKAREEARRKRHPNKD